MVCRLHAVLCELVPGGVSKRITAAHAARVLEQVTAIGPGEIWKIPNFSTLPALPAPSPTVAPAPTAAPATPGAGTGGATTGKIIVKTAEETDRAVHCLRTLSQQYHRHAVEVNRLENEADRMLRDELAALFEGTKDAIEVIKWKELYETMESVTDRCEDVVNVIEGIVLKMA